MRLIDAGGARGAGCRCAAAIDALEARSPPACRRVPAADAATTPDGALLLMPAAGPAGRRREARHRSPRRTRSAACRSSRRMYVLFDPGPQAPLAVIDGSALTAIRTAAVSGLATRLLARARRPSAGALRRRRAGARRTSRRCARYGDLDDVAIVARTPARADALAAELGARVGTPEDAHMADIVPTCTRCRPCARPRACRRVLSSAAKASALAGVRRRSPPPRGRAPPASPRGATSPARRRRRSRAAARPRAREAAWRARTPRPSAAP